MQSISGYVFLGLALTCCFLTDARGLVKQHETSLQIHTDRQPPAQPAPSADIDGLGEEEKIEKEAEALVQKDDQIEDVKKDAEVVKKAPEKDEENVALDEEK